MRFWRLALNSFRAGNHGGCKKKVNNSFKYRCLLKTSGYGPENVMCTCRIIICLLLPQANIYVVPTKKIDSNYRTFHNFPGLFLIFSRTFCIKVPWLFQDFPVLLRSCTNSNNKIYFLQNKHIHPAVYIN